ncbi:hypothetical protein [uncultured Clostridium sp.]|uniref:hypothetical protein n=1 Tax=uncultured Clostridium sp. TaxID=59620 RepID=UPI0025F89FB9|nr:hypothetical protein [uncultured Clostridium sp.]
MIVYFCCAGGPTSMFFANCARRIFKNEDKIYVDNIRKAVKKYYNGELKNYDLIFAQGTGFSATREFFSENHFKELVDMVCLLPQVTFNLPKFKEHLDPMNIQCRTLTVNDCADVFKDIKKARSVFKELSEKYDLEFKENLEELHISFG